MKDRFQLRERLETLKEVQAAYNNLSKEAFVNWLTCAIEEDEIILEDDLDD